MEAAQHQCIIINSQFLYKIKYINRLEMQLQTNQSTILSLYASLAILFISCSQFCTAADIRGKLQLPDPNVPLNSTRVTLTDGSPSGSFSTYSRGSDGSFVFYGVQPGIHLLDVHDLGFHFSHVKIQVPEKEEEEMKCIEYVHQGAAKKPMICNEGINLTAHAKYNYFEKRPTFSVFSMFKNPMFLMMLVTGGLMLLMPKMMEGMDEEQKDQMRRQMELQKDPTKMMSMLLDDFTGSGQKQQQPQVKGAGGKQRKGKR